MGLTTLGLTTTSLLTPGIPSQEEALNLTHKDLLCFAWQIAKGMAYLADMKVGHDW